MKWDTTVTILDITTHQVSQTLSGHTDRILRVNWNEEHILTVSVDGTTRLWDSDTFTQTVVFQTGPSGSVSFSPDGRLFVVDSFDDSTVVVRDSATGEIVAVLDDTPSIPDAD